MSDRRIITLISTGQAKIGRVFIHKGPGSKCKECEYFNVCVKNLKTDRVYRIYNVRERILSCRSYETEMKVVEVKHAETPSAGQAKQAIKGAVITFKTPDCNEIHCDNFSLCFPRGLKTGDRCKVLRVTKNLSCCQSYPLKKVFLQLAWEP